MPKLLVFSQVEDVRQKLNDAMRKMSTDELGRLLELIQNGKTPPNERTSSEPSSKRLIHSFQTVNKI